ncbi:hypothetical protein [Clostridium sp. Marseille-QA1073]
MKIDISLEIESIKEIKDISISFAIRLLLILQTVLFTKARKHKKIHYIQGINAIDSKLKK